MSDTERGSMTRGSDGSHWAGCEKVHRDCALDAKDAEIARLRRERDEARALTRHDPDGYPANLRRFYREPNPRKGERGKRHANR